MEQGKSFGITSKIQRFQLMIAESVLLTAAYIIYLFLERQD